MSKVKFLFCAIVVFAASICASAQLTPFCGENGKWGFKNANGDVVVGCQYAKVHESGFSDGLCAVAKKKANLFGIYQWGFVDETGRLVIPCRYVLGPHGFTEGLCGVLIQRTPLTYEYGYMDKNRNVAIKPRFKYAGPFVAGIAVVKDNKDCWCLINTSGEKITIFPDEVTGVGVVKHGYYYSAGVIGNKYGILDFKGNWIIKPQYDNIFWDKPQEDLFAQGYLKVIKGGVDGYIDRDENWYDIADKGVIEDLQQYASASQDVSSPSHVSTSNAPAQGTIKSIQNSNPTSDVDINIPSYSVKKEDTFVVILANENYRRESKVDYAINDGAIFKEYCIKALGIPDSNIHCVLDATLNDMRAEVDWLTMVAKAFSGDAKLIFYYAGHGVPDETSRSSYLIPVDGYGSNVNTGYKLSDLYASLSACNSKSVFVLLDACFSGAQRNGAMLASARGVALKAKPETPSGNMIVLSAATGDETAYKYDDKGHGMFTYFLLKKLQDGGADTTIGELADFVTKNVSRRAVIENSKPQTPTLYVSPSLEGKWSGLTL